MSLPARTVSMRTSSEDHAPQRRLVRLGDGWLLLAGFYRCYDQYWLLDDTFEVVQQDYLFYCSQLSAVNAGSAVVVVAEGSSRLVRFNADLSVSGYDLDLGPEAVVLSATGQIFVSPSTGGLEVASSGSVYAASGDLLIVFDCGSSLGDCGYRIIGEGGSIPIELEEHITGPVSLQATWLLAPALGSAVIVGERTSLFDLSDGTSVTLQLSADAPSMSWSGDSTLLVLGKVASNGNWSQEGFVFDLDTGIRQRIDPPFGESDVAYAFGP
jgi:hypothetical protein